ncbi:dolichol kinase [Besnoitia besnoiti]|uniref:dolichol kinase n=1 Tax=Besnoitia besnoiti TaxID=94643 RepID=A0A2A9MFK8_BESBE|nr:dolichol kinase [Besnoitia besnoiti]PFH37278.1 dolichol kinase [Besnoitia besnoiti]
MLLAAVSGIIPNDRLVAFYRLLWGAWRLDSVLVVLALATNPSVRHVLCAPLLPLVLLWISITIARWTDRGRGVFPTSQPPSKSCSEQDSGSRREASPQEMPSARNQHHAVTFRQEESVTGYWTDVTSRSTAHAGGRAPCESPGGCRGLSPLTHNARASLVSRVAEFGRQRVGLYASPGGGRADSASWGIPAPSSVHGEGVSAAGHCKGHHDAHDVQSSGSGLSAAGGTELSDFPQRHPAGSTPLQQNSRRARSSSRTLALLLFPGFVCSCFVEFQARHANSSPDGDHEGFSLCSIPFVLVPGLLGGSLLGCFLWTHELAARRIAALVALYASAWSCWIHVQVRGTATTLTLSCFFTAVAVSVFIYGQLLVLHTCSLNGNHCFTLVESMVISQLISTVMFLSASDLLGRPSSTAASEAGVSPQQVPPWLAVVFRLFLILIAGLACVASARARGNEHTNARKGEGILLMLGFGAAVVIYLIAGSSPDANGSHHTPERKGELRSPLWWLLVYVFGDSVNTALFVFWLVSSVLGVASISAFWSGIFLVGIGDGLAAVVGAMFGKRRLPFNSEKTIIGLFAFIAGALPVAFLEPVGLLVSPQYPQLSNASTHAAICAVGLGAVFEAYTSDIDNLTLPLFGVIVYDNVFAGHRGHEGNKLIPAT